MKKPIYISLLFSFFYTSVIFSQRPTFSVATDLGLQRSIKKEQRYWAMGQTVQVHFHFTPKDGMYTWISYYINGKFNNDIAATAKSPLTNPQEIDLVNNASMRFKHFSIGWKHYLKGSSDAKKGWNLYDYVGFGLMFGKVINTHSVFIDTALYTPPVLEGKANFKRLTLDLGLGWEHPLGSDMFFYTEGRLWVPTTDYPSKYIFVNKNAPLVASLNFGVRILFD